MVGLKSHHTNAHRHRSNSLREPSRRLKTWALVSRHAKSARLEANGGACDPDGPSSRTDGEDHRGASLLLASVAAVSAIAVTIGLGLQNGSANGRPESTLFPALLGPDFC